MLEFRHDTVQYIRKAYGLDQHGRMDEAIDILDEWVKKQKHFKKKDFPRNYLEVTIITSKGSLERAKSRLDKLCTLKSLVPQFFGNFDIRNDFKELDGFVTHGILPMLTKDHNRVIFQRMVRHKIENTVTIQYFRIIIMFCEYLKLHEYADGFTLVCDYFDLDVMYFLSKVNITELHQIIVILIEGFGARLKGVHLLSNSKLIYTFVNALKVVLPDKIKRRMYVHHSLEELYKYVEKDILPVQYGGKERPLEQLHDEWVEILGSAEFRRNLEEMSQAGTGESLRSTDVFNTEYMGMPGTFRTFQVD